jgi:hypothetical protein
MVSTVRLRNWPEAHQAAGALAGLPPLVTRKGPAHAQDTSSQPISAQYPAPLTPVGGKTARNRKIPPRAAVGDRERGEGEARVRRILIG